MIASLKRTLNFIHQHPLAKRHLFRAYFNAFSWQIKSKFVHELVQIKFIDQTKFYAKKGLAGITGNIYAGLHEFEDMAFLLHLLKNDDVFFDVGANVGSYTILASGVKKAKTLAFEPIPKTHSILIKNVELNQLQNLVNCENKGVGKKEQHLNFIADGDTNNHVATKNEAKAITVDCVSLDQFYPNFKPILLKIDVEGYETEVLSGATKILADPTLKAVILELNGSGKRYGFDDESIHSKLVTESFEPYSYNPFKRNLTKLNSYGSFNTIYIRDLDFVNNRLSSAPSFRVFNEDI